MHDVFISYSSIDRTIADAVVNILEGNKIKCWIAYRDASPGNDYAVSIVRAIKKSKICVLILSENSNRSKHVLSEINSCVNHGISIIPFKIHDVIAHEAIEYYLGKTHWLDAMSAPIEAHIHRLASKISLNIKDDESQTKKNNPISLTPEVSIYQTRMAKYEELLSFGYDADKIAIQLVENDYVNCNGISEDNEGSPAQWATFIKNSNETSRYLLNGENQIVGDWSILALGQEVFEQAKQGQLLEKDISFDKSEMIVFPDIYYGYILAISILPEYRNMTNYLNLVNSFYEQLEIYAENGIYFKEWVINVFSQEVETFVKRLGFTYLCDNKSFGKIYHLKFMPLPKVPLLDKFPKLKKLYQEATSD